MTSRERFEREELWRHCRHRREGGRIELPDVGQMSLRINVKLKRPTRIKGQNRDKKIVLKDYALVLCKLGIDDVAMQTAPAVFTETLTSPKFLSQNRRNESEGEYLPMWVGHGDADQLAVVFENIDKLDVLLTGKLQVARLPKGDQFFQVVGAKLDECRVMIRMVKNHVAGSPAFAGAEKWIAGVIDFRSRAGKGRKIIGIDMNVVLVGNPTGAWTKGAPLGWHLGALHARRGRGHPLSSYRIVTQLAHDDSFLPGS